MPPILPPLVTAADLTDYGYDAVADALLMRASVRVRRHTRQNITEGTSTVTLHGAGPWLLPQRPVVDVTTVVDEDGTDVEFELHGQVLHAEGCAPLTVTYDHGYTTLPDELVEVVCQIATRLAAQPGAVAAGARQESAGGEAVTWSVEALEGSSGLTPSERKALDRIYPRRPRTAVLL